MTNNFPAIPTNTPIVNIQYTVNINDSGFLAAASVFKLAGVQTSISTPSGSGWPDMIFNFSFSFDTPGNPGSFDQTTVETQMAAILTSLCQAISDTTGETLTQVQALTTVTRLFTFQDTSGDMVQIAQTMTPF